MIFMTCEVIGSASVLSENRLVQTKTRPTTRRTEMSDYAHLASGYIAAWNETDAGKRHAMIETVFAPNAEYRDPIMQGDGHAGIGALIAGVHERFPGFRFALRGDASGFADRLRFSWTLGPDGIEAPMEGTDFVEIADGRMSRITGFLDKVPTQ